MMDEISIVIAIVSLIISAGTAWLTVFRKGTIKMTQPSVIFFGPDEREISKVFLRTLLYSTAARGQVVENLFIKLKHDNSKIAKSFNIWVYGEANQLMRGSGLFVGENGITCNHHFLLREEENYHFLAGNYSVEVYASIVGLRIPQLLAHLHLALTEEESKLAELGDIGIYFDWEPDKIQYSTHLDTKPEIFRQNASVLDQVMALNSKPMNQDTDVKL